MIGVLTNATIKKLPILSVEEFSTAFDEARDRMSDEFIKYEALQFYDEGSDSPLFDFTAGDYETFVDRLTVSRSEEKPFIKSVIDRGVSRSRLHRAVLPMSDYMQFEFYSYLFTSAIGEKIRYVEDSAAESSIGSGLSDFVCFDRRLILAQIYDSGGSLEGAYRIESQDAVSSVCEAYDALKELSVDFREFFTPNEELVANINARLDDFLK